MYSLLDRSFIKNSIFALWTFCLWQHHLVGNWVSNKEMGFNRLYVSQISHMNYLAVSGNFNTTGHSTP